MPSPITTGGFSVQAVPGINYLPASSLVPNSSGLIPAISQGAGLVSQLAQISDQAQLAPVRQQLQQIQLQEAQNQLASAPLTRQLQLAQLAHASQPIEQVLGTELKRIPRINSPDETPAQDANGNYTFAEGDNNYDLVPIQRIAVTDPLTGQVTVQQKTLTPIATAEQLSDRADKLEIQKLREQSLADSRNTDRRLAEARLNSPEWTRLGYGIDPSTGKQAYLIVNKKTGERQAVPSDLVPVPTGQDAFLAEARAIINGGSASKPASAAITVPGASGAVAPVIDQETQGLINDVSGGFKAPGAPAKAIGIDLSKPLTPTEASKLPSGTVFIGIDGIRRTKR